MKWHTGEKAIAYIALTEVLIFLEPVIGDSRGRDSSRASVAAIRICRQLSAGEFRDSLNECVYARACVCVRASAYACARVHMRARTLKL